MSEINAEQAEAINDLDVLDNGMVEFGDVARNVIGMQCQYASRYVFGILGNPDLGSDLRTEGDAYDYHSLLIHRDDVETFVKRVNEFRANL